MDIYCKTTVREMLRQVLCKHCFAESSPYSSGEGFIPVIPFFMDEETEDRRS